MSRCSGNVFFIQESRTIHPGHFLNPFDRRYPRPCPRIDIDPLTFNFLFTDLNPLVSREDPCASNQLHIIRILHPIAQAIATPIPNFIHPRPHGWIIQLDCSAGRKAKDLPASGHMDCPGTSHQRFSRCTTIIDAAAADFAFFNDRDGVSGRDEFAQQGAGCLTGAEDDVIVGFHGGFSCKIVLEKIEYSLLEKSVCR